MPDAENDALAPHNLEGAACSCGEWEAKLGESIQRGFDKHLLESQTHAPPARTTPMNHIDLTRVRGLLVEIQQMTEECDGLLHDDSAALTDQSKGSARRERARRSRRLLLLAHRLGLASSLVEAEYWKARGESDPLT